MYRRHAQSFVKKFLMKTVFHQKKVKAAVLNTLKMVSFDFVLGLKEGVILCYAVFVFSGYRRLLRSQNSCAVPEHFLAISIVCQ